MQNNILKLGLFIVVGITLLQSYPASAWDQKVEPLFPNDITNETKLIVVSDWHWDTVENAVYPTLVSIIKGFAPKFDCIFLEHPSDLQPYLNSFLMNKISWDQYSLIANRLFFERSGKLFMEQHPEVNLNDAEGEGLKFFSNKALLAKKAKESGLKLYAVDSDTFQNALNSNEFRNEVMATNIIRLFKNGDCHFGLLPVGSAHQGGLNPVQDIIRNSCINTNSYQYNDENNFVREN